MIEYFEMNDSMGLASIYERHIQFNAKLIKYFNNIYRVRFGYDLSEKKGYMFLFDKDKALNGEYNESSLFKFSESKSYIRISSKVLVDFILKKFNLSLDGKNCIQFDANYDDLKKCICIDFGGEK